MDVCFINDDTIIQVTIQYCSAVDINQTPVQNYASLSPDLISEVRV